mmetsp:Transcript_101364/g.282130  ORF Transcript_101364/g.282130 Transcript_101364/m.282130 type:complete len:224 (-) Transcript_101364:68-739(-)
MCAGTRPCKYCSTFSGASMRTPSHDQLPRDVTRKSSSTSTRMMSKHWCSWQWDATKSPIACKRPVGPSGSRPGRLSVFASKVKGSFSSWAIASSRRARRSAYCGFRQVEDRTTLLRPTPSPASLISWASRRTNIGVMPSSCELANFRYVQSSPCPSLRAQAAWIVALPGVLWPQQWLQKSLAMLMLSSLSSKGLPPSGSATPTFRTPSTSMNSRVVMSFVPNT